MNLRQLVNSAGQKLNQFSDNAKTNLAGWGKVVSNPQVRSGYVNTVVKPTVSRVINTPANAVNTVTNIAQMTTNPFGRNQISNYIRSKVSPNVPFVKNDFYHVGQPVPQWNTLPQKEKNRIGVMDQLDELIHPRVAGETPQLYPYFQPPKGEAKPNAYRDEAINKNGYTPEVQKYIKTIGIVAKPEGSNVGVDWSAGTAYGGRHNHKFVEVSPNNGGYNPQVMGHELMHQIDYVTQNYKPEQFLADVAASAKENPALKPALNFIDQYKKDQPDYFGVGKNADNYPGDINALRNGTLATEMFAEIGSEVGPSILRDPILAKYYKGIFQETPQNYPGWVTPVPTPVNPNAPKKVIMPAQKTQMSGYGMSVPSMKKQTKIILRKVKK